MFSQATDELLLLPGEESSSPLVIAPTSHSNIGQFFNAPSIGKRGSILPSSANLELVRFCIETQVRVMLITKKEIKKGYHMVWRYNRKD